MITPGSASRTPRLMRGIHAHVAASLAIWVLAALPARANPVKTDQVQVSLMARQTAIQPGGRLELGIFFELADHWHIYWQNPGDSGEAPRIKWDIPDGFTPGPIVWPAPQRIASGPLMNFGYEGQVLLPVTIDVDGDLPHIAEGQTVTLRARVTWLVCSENCIPGQATLALALPVQSAASPHNQNHEALFANTQERLPIPVSVRIEEKGEHLLVHIPHVTGGEPPLGPAPDLDASSPIKHTLFPLDALAIAHAAPQNVVDGPDGLIIQVKKDDTHDRPLPRLSGVVVSETNAGRWARSFSSTIETNDSSSVRASVTPSDPSPPGTPTTGLWLALGLAFMGGVLLNLMPCVFPVLSLKVLSFCAHAHDRSATRRHGWAYTAGVMLSFWLLAGLLLGVRTSTQALGWGFQLQSPVFIALLSVIIFLFGLNLMGAFEIGLALTRLGGLGSNDRGVLGSFSTGILATVVATPCTAPFMGTAVGWALVQPTLAALAVFTALGSGMAAPYLTLSYFPTLLRRLPRPGRWMETLRQALAFPLFATVIWLLAVFAQLTDPFAVFPLLAGLLIVALGAWVFGRYQTSAARPLLGWIAALVLLCGGTALAVRSATRVHPAMADTTTPDIDTDMWQPWSAERLAALRAQGRPVFVNFTAAWCISCKANEIMVFSTDAVKTAFAQRQVATLKADWTHRDQAIARELERHGRAGVPLYLYYPPQGGAPRTLPSVLTKGIVLSYLDQ